MMNTKAVTLAEIVIVTVVFSVLAAVAIPTYQKAQEQAKEKAASQNLAMIKVAVQKYIRDNDGAALPSMTDLDDLHANLKVKILSDSDFSYQCLPVSGTYTNFCSVSVGGNWALMTHDGISGVVCDNSVGNCPTY